MQSVDRMISTSPHRPRGDVSKIASCVKACLECEATCVACADACLGESEIDHLRRCIRLNLDCADLCSAVGHIVSRMQEPDERLSRAGLEACVAACHACAAECDRHEHEHCKVCAEACRRCEKACKELLAAFVKVAAK
jgi:hypothetical protein